MIIGAGQDTARPAPKINTITCGDCLEVMQSIPDKSIDMILCDLPYGTTACKWDTVIPFALLWEHYNRICKGSVLLFGSEPFSSLLRVSNLKKYRYDWIWEKNRGGNYQLTKYQPMKKHEIISVFNNGLYIPQMIFVGIKDNRKTFSWCSPDKNNRLVHMNSGKTRYKKDNGFRYPSSIIVCDGDYFNRFHPTQKPVALFEYLIRTYTNEGETVLDNCIGSGTTAIACINTGRNYIGIEKEEKYCRIAEERIHALRSPAQNTMEICHTAPNSASPQ